MASADITEANRIGGALELITEFTVSFFADVNEPPPFAGFCFTSRVNVHVRLPSEPVSPPLSLVLGLRPMAENSSVYISYRVQHTQYKAGGGWRYLCPTLPIHQRGLPVWYC